MGQEQQQYVLYSSNGAERTRVNDVKVTDGETYRFYAASPTDNAEVDGTWDATFTDEASKA